jgi:hypothetical protein
MEASNVTVNDETIGNKNIKVIVPNDDNTFQIKKELVRLLLKYLNNGFSVIINPVNSPGYNISAYTSLQEKLLEGGLYSDLELVFNPKVPIQVRASSYYKPGIDLTQPVYLNPKDSRLIDFISMHLSLDDFSTFLSNGNYEFMSLLRVGYLKSAPVIFNTTQQGGAIACPVEPEGFEKSEVKLDNNTKGLEEAMNIPIPPWLKNTATKGGKSNKRKYRNKSTRKKIKHKNKLTRHRRK